MKIWITRDSAGSIMAGGLERVRVWFTRPKWVEAKIFQDDPLNTKDQGGYFEDARWQVIQAGPCEAHPVSFGNIFGYIKDNEPHLAAFAEYVWSKLCEHFHGESSFDQWLELEKQGKSRIQDFFLEIELSVTHVKTT